MTAGNKKSTKIYTILKIDLRFIGLQQTESKSAVHIIQ